MEVWKGKYEQILQPNLATGRITVKLFVVLAATTSLGFERSNIPTTNHQPELVTKLESSPNPQSHEAGQYCRKV
jgi:hypothetical protein